MERDIGHKDGSAILKMGATSDKKFLTPTLSLSVGYIKNEMTKWKYNESISTAKHCWCCFFTSLLDKNFNIIVFQYEFSIFL